MRAMDNTAQEFPRISDYLKSRHGASENNATICVVRNVVFNMESVLTDLKGIMGEITNIVDHIDTVTGRTDKHYKAGKDNRDLLTCKHDLGKSLSANYWESKLVYTNTDVSPKADNQSADDPSQMTNTELKVKGFSQHQDFLSPKQQKKYGTENIDGTARLEWKNSSKMLSLSKEFNHIGKHGMGILPQNGAIAIVHPTIINSLPAMSRNVSTETSAAQKSVSSGNCLPVMPCKRNTEISSIQKSIDVIDNNSQRQTLIAKSSFQKFHKSKNDLSCILQANSETDRQDIEENFKQEKEKQNTDITFNRHVYILPDQKSPLNGTKQKQHSHLQLSNRVSTNLQAVVESSETSTVNEPVEFDTEYSRDMKAQFNRVINRTGEVDLLPKRSQPYRNQELMFKSPLMRHSSPKSVYSKVQSSPASVRSLNTKSACETRHYYYSTESDADSDSCVEYHDIRSITPDIDWSYLNLVGNGNAKDSIMMIADTQICTPVISTVDRGKPQNVYARHKIADVEGVSEELNTSSLLEAKEKFNKMPTICDYTITGSPVLVHIFCSEVSSYESEGYCGYYEAILDSVLENVAGFESFEEACDAIENIGILNETYASCDTEFEEDDWDIGMKSGHQDEYPSHPSHIHQHECLHFGSLECVDRNQNVLAANSRNPNRNYESGYGNRNITTVLPGPSKATDEAPYKKRSKESPPVAADNENQESFKGSASGHFIFDNDNGATKMVSSNLNQNLIFRPESILSPEQHLNKEQVIMANSSDLESDKTLNDVASCSNDGSPMSFGSSEIAYTTPATDHVESASEDDPDSSQYDSASLSSELGYDAKMVMHKAKLKRLRREFFLSMYRKLDDKGMEAVDNNYSVTSLDDIVGLGQSLSRLDNRDNVSESESYHDNVTSYNKSINTWTAYALVDLQSDDMSDSTSDVFSENSSI